MSDWNFTRITSQTRLYLKNRRTEVEETPERRAFAFEIFQYYKFEELQKNKTPKV